MNLLTLSPELLEEIGNQLGHPDHTRLRAVCKDLEGATQRLFFSSLILNTGEHLFSRHDFLSALVSGTTGWNAYTRKIVFKPGPYVRPEKYTDEEREVLRGDNERLFSLALETLSVGSNIQAVEWQPAQNEIQPQYEAIHQFISRIPALLEFDLDISRIESHLFSLPSIGQELRRIGIKCRRWHSHVQWASNRDVTPSLYRHISQAIGTQKGLVRLELEGDTGEWSHIWTILRKARLQLCEIATNVLTTEFFEYLLLYSGLQKLDTKHHDAGNRPYNDRLAETFYGSVLSHHADSLVELSCPPAYESQFSFGEHNVHVLPQLSKLESLAMSVNAGRSKFVDWSKRGDSERVLYIGNPVEIEQADVDSPVNLLLETATRLPALRNLTISAADTNSNRGVRCGNGIIHHTSAVTPAILHTLKEFRSKEENPVAVRVGYAIHELRLAEEGGAWQYEQTAKVPWR
ncbi:hypothetical protein FB45DRAFT_932976 [Roridomyces roridus]|uniref:F-box domain-containing protein n=1 Tax=Roridomyces roridus TaxID=1738132 RepID=A0AAD7FGV5_9AGAR|nr:hypothetical protein FB45DRAFT_932976 [Roridomyces roridus]